MEIFLIFFFQIILISVYLGYIGAFLQHGKDRRFKWCGYFGVFVHVLAHTILMLIRNALEDTTALIFSTAFLFVCLRMYAVSAKVLRESFILLLICLEFSNSNMYTVSRKVRFRDYMRTEHTFIGTIICTYCLSVSAYLFG